MLGGKRNIDGVVISGWQELKHPFGHKCGKAAKYLNFGDSYVPSFSPTITLNREQIIIVLDNMYVSEEKEKKERALVSKICSYSSIYYYC